MKKIIFFYCFSAMASAQVLTVPATHLNAPIALTRAETTLTLTQQDIQQSGAATLTQFLADEAGVQVYNSTGNLNESTLSLRGFGENAFANTAILIDGFPIANPDMAAPLLDTIPLDTITAIQVTPNSNNLFYGDNATGGVINIITQQTKNLSTLSATTGSYHQAGLDAYRAQTLSHGFSYIVQGNQDYNKGYRQHNNLNQTHVTAQIGYRTLENNTVLHHDDTFLAQQLPGAIVQGTPPTQGQAGQFANSHLHNTTLQFSQALPHTLRFTSEIAERDAETNGILLSQFSQSRTTTTLMPRLSGLLTFDHIHFTTGIDLEQDHYRYTMPTLSTFDVHDQRHMESTFAHTTIPLSAQWSGLLGARFAANQNTLNDATDHRALTVTEQGIILQPNDRLQFYLKRAGTYRFPKADETSNTADATPLNTQTGVSYETGSVFHTEQTRVALSLYQLDLTNEIAFAPALPNQPLATNRNLDPTRRRGFSLQIKQAITSRLQIGSQYNLVNAVYRSGPFIHKHIPFVSRQLFELNCHYQWTTRWSSYFSALYTGSRFPSEDDNNTRDLGGYTVYNVSLGYQFTKWHVSARVNNIFGKLYNNYALLPAGTQTVFVYPANGRNFLVTVTYDFAT